MFSETTITELLLLELAEKAPGIVTVVPFKPAEERKNGADWQWCFANQSMSLFAEARIQAKRLYQNGKYGSLLHKYDSGSPRFQMNRLIDEASKARVPPLYVFYNHLQQSDAELVSNGRDPINLWGCSFATADDVKDCIYRTPRGYSGTQFRQVGLISRPWHELVCPGSGESTDQPVSLPERIAAIIRGELVPADVEARPYLKARVAALPDLEHVLEIVEEVGHPAESDGIEYDEPDLLDEETEPFNLEEYQPLDAAPIYVDTLSREQPRDTLTGFVDLPREQKTKLRDELGDIPGVVIIQEPKSEQR
ncbi:DUF6615 family protein [Stappia sp. BW2]|uniref:DUF6615 family protein n=1 Tax=Stappia sp. BW2 TaxID=2592622 RepID=UPI001396C899|nr:DUF6615 family protein [Stappia sp. BW2]